MSKYNDFTNAELKQFCEDEGIDVDSKNVSKPTKKEYIAAIEAFNAKNNADAEDFLATEEPVVEPEAKKEEPKTTTKETRAQKRRRQYNEMHALKRVIITSNATNQTKTQAIERITWGNRLLGHNTDNVVLGKPWHVRQGALNNMKNAKTTNSIQDDEGNQVRFETVNTYNIQMLDPLTPEEIEKIAKRQTIRDASIESLV